MATGTAAGENVRDARGEHACFAGACASENQYRPVEGFDGGALSRVEALEIWGARRPQCTRRNVTPCRGRGGGSRRRYRLTQRGNGTGGLFSIS
jgi:hypothetical protein